MPHARMCSTKITVGLDLGDRYSRSCMLDAHSGVIEERRFLPVVLRYCRLAGVLLRCLLRRRTAASTTAAFNGVCQAAGPEGPPTGSCESYGSVCGLTNGSATVRGPVETGAPTGLLAACSRTV